jgi:uncharacterized protein with ParB-like and HNH nuclease domain
MDHLILLVLNFLLNNNVDDEFCVGIFIILFIIIFKNGICSITLSEVFASCAKKRTKLPQKKKKKEKKSLLS